MDQPDAEDADSSEINAGQPDAEDTGGETVIEEETDAENADAEDTDGEQLLEPGMSLMEVKCAGAMPLWFVRELSAMSLRKTSFSKYGTAWARSGAEVAALRTSLVPLRPSQPVYAPAPIPYPARIRTPRHAAQAHVA